MTHEEALAKLTEILSRDFQIPADKVVMDATFRGTLGLDSLDAVDLVYLVSRAAGLKPDLHSFRELHTVEKVVQHLVAEVNRKSTG